MSFGGALQWDKNFGAFLVLQSVHCRSRFPCVYNCGNVGKSAALLIHVDVAILAFHLLVYGLFIQTPGDGVLQGGWTRERIGPYNLH